MGGGDWVDNKLRINSKNHMVFLQNRVTVKQFFMIVTNQCRLMVWIFVFIQLFFDLEIFLYNNVKQVGNKETYNLMKFGRKDQNVFTPRPYCCVYKIR